MGPGPINPFGDFMKGAGDVISSVLPGAGLITGIASGIGNLIGGNIQQDRNFALQGAQLDYQKKMQQTQWEREDNAVQRRVNDLKAAGLSPVLAAGSSAQAGAPINVTAPQRQYIPSDTDSLGMTAQMAQIAQSKAQAALTAVEAEKKAYALQYFKEQGVPEEGMDIWGKRIAEVLSQLNTNIPNVTKATKDLLIDPKLEGNGLFSPKNIPIIGGLFK